MAGLAGAAALSEVGCKVVLFDKGRGPGGRMSTRRMQTPLGELAIDHGAQYFTVRDSGFRQQVLAWEADGITARWPLAGPDAWIGTPGMNAVIKAMAHGQDVRWASLVERIAPGPEGWQLTAGGEVSGPYDAVILAVPPEQAIPHLSLHDFELARQVVSARSQPCWTAMFAFAEPLGDVVDMVRESGIVGWAARNAAKPGRTGPEGWVVQAVPEWSRAHVEDTPDYVMDALLTALARALGTTLPTPVASAAHRWRYAMSGGLGAGALWNPRTGLGVCGDWLLGPRIECAWLSGQHLARLMMEESFEVPVITCASSVG